MAQIFKALWLINAFTNSFSMSSAGKRSYDTEVSVTLASCVFSFAFSLETPWQHLVICKMDNEKF